MLAAIGWGLLWIFTAGKLPCSKASVATAYFIGANAQTWFDTGALVTTVGNFPAQRGAVVGLEKSYTGLGASVLAEIYTAFFRVSGSEDGVTPFLLALTLGLVTVPLVCSIFIVKSPGTDNNPPLVWRRITIGYILTSLLAGVLLVAAVIQAEVIVSAAVKYALLVLASLLLLSLCGIPLVGRMNDFNLGTINDPSLPLLGPDPATPVCSMWCSSLFSCLVSSFSPIPFLSRIQAHHTHIFNNHSYLHISDLATPPSPSQPLFGTDLSAHFGRTTLPQCCAHIGVLALLFLCPAWHWCWRYRHK